MQYIIIVYLRSISYVSIDNHKRLVLLKCLVNVTLSTVFIFKFIKSNLSIKLLLKRKGLMLQILHVNIFIRRSKREEEKSTGTKILLF